MQKFELSEQVNDRAPTAAQRKGLQRDVYDFALRNSPSIRKGNFSTLASADIGSLFQINDELFFDGKISRWMEINFKRPIKFRLSTRMTTCGGMTTMQRFPGAKQSETEFEIAIATTPLFGTFKEQGRAKVGGLVCQDRLEALQRILEHEMIHLVELLIRQDSNCQRGPFKRLINNYFGHTESNHQLLTPADVARQKLGISCGDYVVFEMEGRQLRGYVNRITKRATVLVKDASGVRYSDGLKYAKYYVPLNRIKRAS